MNRPESSMYARPVAFQIRKLRLMQCIISYSNHNCPQKLIDESSENNDQYNSLHTSQLFVQVLIKKINGLKLERILQKIHMCASSLAETSKDITERIQECITHKHNKKTCEGKRFATVNLFLSVSPFVYQLVVVCSSHLHLLY
jgi:hypothetical protein